MEWLLTGGAGKQGGGKQEAVETPVVGGSSQRNQGSLEVACISSCVLQICSVHKYKTIPGNGIGSKKFIASSPTYIHICTMLKTHFLTTTAGGDRTAACGKVAVVSVKGHLHHSTHRSLAAWTQLVETGQWLVAKWQQCRSRGHLHHSTCCSVAAWTLLVETGQRLVARWQ